MLTFGFLNMIVESMQLDNGVDETSSGSHQVCDLSLILRVSTKSWE